MSGRSGCPVGRVFTWGRVCTVEDACVPVVVARVCTCGRVCIGAPFSLDTGCAAFEFVPLAPVFERGCEDDLRTVADLCVTEGIEVVELELGGPGSGPCQR